MNSTAVATALTAVSLSSKGLPPYLVGQTLAELKGLMSTLEEPSFRAEQLYQWLYVKCKRQFSAMSNLAKTFQEKLGQYYPEVGPLTLKTKQVSSDGTRKYLFTLPDGEVIESVLMYFERRNTYSVCISTQVGCAMNCSFCATGKLGLKRHLTAAEILDQYLFVQAEAGVEVRNVVFMGQGEPLHNYEPTLQAMKLLNEAAEVSYRRMTVSTSGLVPTIERLAKEQLPITLAVSLHAADNATRESIMPINKRYPLERLMPALRAYADATHRRLTIEFVMIEGVNDSLEQAHKLGKLLKGLHANINLIPYNPIAASLPGVANYKRSNPQVIRAFSDLLYEQYGRKVTVRLERGVDIDAACGQLANR